MKPFRISAAILCAGATIFAADPAPTQSSGAPRNPVQRLEEIKLKNKALLEKQAETLKLLENLELQSQQLKFMGRRT